MGRRRRRRFDESKIHRDHRSGRFSESTIAGLKKLAESSSRKSPTARAAAASVALQKRRLPRLGDPPIVTSSVEEAVELLGRGHRVELNRPSEVSTLLRKLADIAQDAKAKGSKAPNYDLCKVTVKGTSLFCVHTKGIDRLKMPQFRGKPIPGSIADGLPRDFGSVDTSDMFRAELRAKGIAIRPRKRKASHLKASQNEINGVTVAGIMGRLERKETEISEVLMVSRDEYIVDGHHRWAALVGHDADDDDLEQMEVQTDEIDLPIIELLALATEFTNRVGIPSRGFASRLDVQRTTIAPPFPDQQGGLLTGFAPAQGNLVPVANPMPQKPHEHIIGTAKIPLSQIRKGNNTRKVFDPAKLKELADSMNELGLAQPITLRPMGDGYEIVAGERRFRAAELNGWETIDAHVRNLTDEEAYSITLTENAARVDLDPIDEAEGYQRGMDEFGWDMNEVAKRGGVTPQRVLTRVRLLKLVPEAQHLVRIGQLSGQSGLLMGDLDPNRQRLALAAVADGLNGAGLVRLSKRLKAEQDQDVLFSADSFLQVDEYKRDAEKEVKKGSFATAKELIAQMAAALEEAGLRPDLTVQARERVGDIEINKTMVMEALSPELEAPYKPPRTVSDAEKRLRALGWEVDLKDLPGATKIAEALEGLATKYPGTARKLRKVGKLEGADDTAAQVAFPEWKMSVNPRFTSSSGLRKYQETERFRFHPKNTGNIKGMISHEWGHLVVERIIRSPHGPACVGKMREINSSDTAKTHGYPSIYAGTHAVELMAETFADFEVNGEDAHPLSVLMAKAILKFDQLVAEDEI